MEDIILSCVSDEDTKNKLVFVNLSFYELIRGMDARVSLQCKVRAEHRFQTELIPALKKQPETVQIAVGRLFGNNDRHVDKSVKRNALSRSYRIVRFAAGQKTLTDVSYVRIADYMADARPLIDEVPVCLCDMLCDAFQPDKSTAHWDFLGEIIRKLQDKNK